MSSTRFCVFSAASGKPSERERPTLFASFLKGLLRLSSDENPTMAGGKNLMPGNEPAVGCQNMCTQWLCSGPCMNNECPHNLFWRKLRLNAGKITITKKALEIRNCCCLINEAWTPEEIRDAWGLERKKITQYEQTAWRKVRRRKRNLNSSALSSQGKA